MGFKVLIGREAEYKGLDIMLCEKESKRDWIIDIPHIENNKVCKNEVKPKDMEY